MDFENVERFRDAASAEGLILELFGTKEPHFFFDLNQGQINCPPDPPKVYRLVELARLHAESAGYGEHNALLNLVARRDELESPSLYWHRSYHVNASQNPERWISLRDWLKEKGYETAQFNED
jgi:hypothetical protein